MNENTGKPNNPMIIGNQTISAIAPNTGYVYTLTTRPKNQYNETIIVDAKTIRDSLCDIKLRSAIQVVNVSESFRNKLFGRLIVETR